MKDADRLVYVFTVSLCFFFFLSFFFSSSLSSPLTPKNAKKDTPPVGVVPYDQLIWDFEIERVERER